MKPNPLPRPDPPADLAAPTAEPEPGAPAMALEPEPAPPQARLPRPGDTVWLHSVQLPLAGGEVRSSTPARVVSVADETNPHSVLSLEISYAVELPHAPPARPELFHTFTRLRDHWTIADLDGEPLPDPKAEEPPTVDSTNVVVYQPTLQGRDEAVPATVLDATEYPYLTLRIEETVRISANYGTSNNEWSWAAEPAPETMQGDPTNE
jgi:hypothetical protein